MRIPILVVFSVGWLLAVQTPPASSLSENEFTTELDRCRAFIEQGKWDRARTDLLALLDAHRDQDYVLVHRIELEDRLKQCAFRAEYSPPPLSALISGKVLSYRESTGWVRIRYEGDKLDDFTFQKVDEQKSSGWGDRVAIHPIEFTGSYSIQIESEVAPTVWVCVESFRQSHLIHFPGRTRGALGQMIGNRYRPLDSYDRTPPRSSRQSYKAKVTSSEIAAYLGSKKVMRVKNEKSYFGKVAFLADVRIQEVQIEGKADPSWIKGLFDQAMKNAYSEFEKSYKPEKIVPDWLLAHKKGIKSSKKGIFGKLLSNLAGTDPRSRLSEEARPSYDAALKLSGKERYKEASRHCRRLRGLASDHFEARALCAKVSLQGSGRAIGIADYEELVRDFPTNPTAVEQLCDVLMRDGQSEKAMEIIKASLERNVWSQELEETNALVLKATRGPLWPKIYEHRSKHYAVSSDIDERTCRDATTILEAGYRAYQYRLKRVSQDSKKPFRVYIFSNRQGYGTYCSSIGTGHQSSVGLYSPYLKQLLIYNAIDRGRMENTIRHEGLHQYLDHVMPDPPRWFNEGLAEYFELARTSSTGRWEEGQVNASHLATLGIHRRTDKIIPLDEFLFVEDVKFMGDAFRHYAQSWAFVHFLRQGEQDTLFENLFERLLEAPAWRPALREFFRDIELEPLEVEFRNHLKSLR